MTKKERYQYFLQFLSSNAESLKTELQYSNEYELLISVMLSAQCTDKRVNSVTPPFFQRFPRPLDVAKSTFEEIFPFFKSISYPNSKTQNIIKTCKIVVEKYDEKLPDKRDLLMKLPGVGRKTANVLTSVLFNQPHMPVDTHVFRVSKRLGLVAQNAKNPMDVEKQLIQNIPKNQVYWAHHGLVLHGRYICLARKPKCESCHWSAWCRMFEKKNKE